MSFCVKLSVGSPVPYQVPTLNLHGHVYEIEVSFKEGINNSFTSPELEFGDIHIGGRRKLLGALTFRYSYDVKRNIVRICGTDFPSADGMAFITRPEGTEQYAYEHAANAGFAADEVHHNRDWNYNSPLMPGAAKIFKDIARSANEALIAALAATNNVGIQIRETLPAGLPLEHYLKLSTVHHPDGRLIGAFDPAHNYGEGVQIKKLDSYYGGKWNVPVNGPFANVIGSTPDPTHSAPSWIALWIAVYGGVTPVGCTSLNFPSTVKCGPVLIGGHVIDGEVPAAVASGSNDVMILPICHAHNNNNKVYMEAITRQNAIWLSNYMN
ncbi:hypothetical protein TWF225_004672 [Orbilia oligospora]|nr:hypothetical protein TWF225_004672 [Orbilia oligospora]KAF3246303.1 hypothetical protein TWF217_009975 [Orbilia oligospora]KAF3266108.1 hypothetical protein TWF128_011643 [Orbilia oligospora]